jgi:hypothetical protein
MPWADGNKNQFMDILLENFFLIWLVQLWMEGEKEGRVKWKIIVLYDVTLDVMLIAYNKCSWMNEGAVMWQF